MDASGWVPLWWPCGPLELERAGRRAGFGAREAEALRQWSDPQRLELVAGTPVNCLVLPWALGSPRDAEQPQALGALVAEAGRRGLSVVGWLAAGADTRRAAEAARASGLSALASEGDPVSEGIEELRFGGRSLASRTRAKFLGVSGMLWPGLREPQADGADAVSGPTGPPWLDSNAWYVRLARTLLDPERLWLAFDPPETGQPLAGSAYVQAIADTQIFGARWPISLDTRLRVGLAERAASALDTWATIGRALAFFERHRAWSSYPAAGQLGVVSDYAGTNELLAYEALNLLARQGSLYRILVKQRALETCLAGLDAVLYVDETPASGDLARTLLAFAESGGTLITPPGWDAHGPEQEALWAPRFRVFRHGRGRLAVARAALTDPYLLAEDAQLLMGHRFDRIRLFNPGVGQRHYALSADGRAGVLHSLLFQAPDSRMPTTVWFRRPWAEAHAWSIERDVAPVARRAVEDGVEFHAPPLPIYSALEVSA